MLVRIAFLLRARKVYIFLPLLLFFAVFAASFGFAQATQPQTAPQKQTAPEPVALERGKPVERTFPGGLETHSYLINLAAGQYAKVVIDQRGIDVYAQLFTAADNNLITRFDGEIRLKEKEEIEFVADNAGEYRLDVKTKFKSSAGNYEIRLAEVREAGERDRALFASRVSSQKGEELVIAGKYAEAAPMIAGALETAEKQAGADSAFTGLMLNRLGYLQRQQGNYAAAEATLRRALAVNEKALGPDHPQTNDSIIYLGLVYRSTNDFGKSDKMCRQALAVTEKTLGAEHPKMVGQLINFEALLHDMGDAELSERVLQRALTIAEKYYEPDSLTVCNLLNNLGSLYEDAGKYDQAEPLFRQVLANYEKTIGTENDRYSNTLQNLGIVLRYRKEYPEALSVYERALAIREKILGKDHLYIAPLLNNIANVYHALGNYAKAAETQLRALAIAEKSGGLLHGQAIQSLTNLTKIYSAQGDIANALAFQTMADERNEKALVLDLAMSSERQKFLQLDELSERTSRTISLSVNLAPAEGSAAALAALVVLQRKGRVLDAMSEAFTSLRERSDPEDKKLLDELNSITAQLSKLALHKPLKLSVEDQQKQIAELTDKKETLEAGISRRSAEFRALAQPVTLAAVQAEIPADAALVEFAVYHPYNPKAQNNDEAYGEPRYIAYVLRHGGDVRWKDLGDTKPIDAVIEQWRRQLRDPKQKDVQSSGRRVDEKIMQPVRNLAGDAAHFLISPDGELNLIPFEALVDEKNRYLVENYSFTYLTSGRDLLRMKVGRTNKSPALLIANPQFGAPAPAPATTPATAPAETGKTGKPTGGKRQSLTAARSMSDTYFAPLAGTIEEARSIKLLFPEAVFLSGEQATETALKQAAAPQILHIATHGFFLEDKTEDAASDKSQTATRDAASEPESDNPLLRSGLALAGANQRDRVGILNGNTAGDDGILTALEASGLNLWGTKLVVLSACDTGLGEVRNGEGVYGLRRSFVLAGAESLVMSLWPVSDFVTRELMTSYYKNLKQGMGRGAALRAVQLEMLKRKGREHPFYWADFIQSGEWADLDGRR